MIPTIITAGVVLAAIIFVIILIKSCWKVAGTNEVLIVSGLGRVKTKTHAVSVQNLNLSLSRGLLVP